MAASKRPEEGSGQHCPQCGGDFIHGVRRDRERIRYTGVETETVKLSSSKESRFRIRLWLMRRCDFMGISKCTYRQRLECFAISPKSEAHSKFGERPSSTIEIRKGRIPDCWRNSTLSGVENLLYITLLGTCIEFNRSNCPDLWSERGDRLPCRNRPCVFLTWSYHPCRL